jgi:hypothetical protein
LEKRNGFNVGDILMLKNDSINDYVDRVWFKNKTLIVTFVLMDGKTTFIKFNNEDVWWDSKRFEYSKSHIIHQILSEI